MNDNTFTGDLTGLRKHWEDEARAIRFRSGASRSRAVISALSKLGPYISQEIWVDVAPGSGYVQTEVASRSYPNLFLGVDLSYAMLKAQESPIGERIQGSVFNLPLRSGVANLVSMFFSLSDYPNLDEGLLEMCRVSSDFVSFVDYGDCDEYWIHRKRLHGKVINGKKVTGNINLRSLKEIAKAFPRYTRLVNQQMIEYDIEDIDFDELNLNFPIHRCFSFTLVAIK
ncbi:MAG: methyltransferase domain-containing protein [Candidatus Heimdallarchaeota archaeon]|nr:methyltransferase domain-containing protein [Candidatus Heimdallarchaeota archaeon]